MIQSPQSKGTSNQARLDLIVAAIVGISLFILASLYDVNERFVEWAEEHETFELDEIPFSLSMLAFAFGWYAYRRWREYSAAAVTMSDINSKLQREVEERRIADAALHYSEHRFRDFAEASADWFWEVDADDKFTYLSPNVERIIGVPASWYYGRTLSSLKRHDFDAEGWALFDEKRGRREPIRDFLYRRVVGKGEYSGDIAKGNTRWFRSNAIPRFDDSGKFLGYRGTTSDVTDAVQAEGALRESEERYRRLVELSPDGIILHSSSRVVFANPAAMRLLGAQSEAEFLGQRTADFVRRDFRRAFLAGPSGSCPMVSWRRRPSRSC